MRTESHAVDDYAAGIEPRIVCNQPDDVAEVAVTGESSVWVRFVDGTCGLVHLAELIGSHSAGVFAVLRDPEIFSRAQVIMGAVTWPGGIDLAPDAMYAALRRHGEWRLR